MKNNPESRREEVSKETGQVASNESWGDLDSSKWKMKMTYQTQFIQDTLINPAFLEIDARSLNHILYNLLIYLTDLSIRHLE